jgi:hypothetical protein
MGAAYQEVIKMAGKQEIELLKHRSLWLIINNGRIGCNIKLAAGLGPITTSTSRKVRQPGEGAR